MKIHTPTFWKLSRKKTFYLPLIQVKWSLQKDFIILSKKKKARCLEPYKVSVINLSRCMALHTSLIIINLTNFPSSLQIWNIIKLQLQSPCLKKLEQYIKTAQLNKT